MLQALIALCLWIAASIWCDAREPAVGSDGYGLRGLTEDMLADPDADGRTREGDDDGDLLASCCSLQAEEPRDGGGTARLYAGKVLGITFANLTTSAVHSPRTPDGVSAAWSSPTSTNSDLFSAAIAGGVWVPRDVGAVRFECEGALRDNADQASSPASDTAISVTASDNWSVLANVWREIPLTARFGAYAGAGVGGGGYRLNASGPGGAVASRQTAVFAWQAGGGAVWRYNSLIALDISYRFLDVGTIDASLVQPGIGSIGTVSSKMKAGELFFMFRVFEPFQWAKHLRSRSFCLPE